MTELALRRHQRPPVTIADRVRAITAADVAVATTGLAMATLPLLVPAGPANITPADAFIAVAVVATAVWASKTRHVWRFPFIVAVGLYMVGGAVGALVGPVPGAGVVALVQDIVLLFWCWAIVNICSTPRRLQVVLGAWAYSSVVWTSVLVVGLVTGTKVLSGETVREGARTTLTLSDPNYAGNYFFLSLMIVLASGRPRRRGARIAACLVLIVALVSTGSNSALASLASATAVFLLLRLYRRRGARAAAVALVCVAVAGYVGASLISFNHIQQWAQGSSYAFLRDGIGRGDSSIQERSTILHESLNLYRRGGILGQGPNSTKTRLAAAQAPYVKEAHDDYVATLLERGVIGSVGLILLLAGLLQRTFVTVTRPLARGFAAAVPYPSALVGAVVGALVGSAFNELLHARHVWALFAVVAALSVWGTGWQAGRESPE
jgi:O-Antigen ligase